MRRVSITTKLLEIILESILFVLVVSPIGHYPMLWVCFRCAVINLGSKLSYEFGVVCFHLFLLVWLTGCLFL